METIFTVSFWIVIVSAILWFIFAVLESRTPAISINYEFVSYFRGLFFLVFMTFSVVCIILVFTCVITHWI